MDESIPQFRREAFESLPGVDLSSTDLERLFAAGIVSLDVLARSDEAALLAAGLPRDTASRILAAFEPGAPGEALPAHQTRPNRQARGLEAARGLEHASQFLRHLISYTSEAPGGTGRKRTQRQVRRLAEHLDAVQHAVLIVGLSRPALTDLQRRLDTFEKKTRRIIARAPDRDRLRAVRRQCKRLRRQLERAN